MGGANGKCNKWSQMARNSPGYGNPTSGAKLQLVNKDNDIIMNCAPGPLLARIRKCAIETPVGLSERNLELQNLHCARETPRAKTRHPRALPTRNKIIHLNVQG